MQIFKQISENWFLTEPAFFALFCTQKLQENVKMECAMRCGQGVIEYNPLVLAHKNYHEAEQLARIEMIRLFLKHPYERQPDGCSREAMALGSDCAIEDGYCLLNEKFPLKGPAFYHLPIGETYEYYAKEIQKSNSSKDNNTNNNKTDNHNNNNNNENNHTQSETGDRGEIASLWRDDAVKRSQINDLIERTNDWGSIPGNIIEKIKASTRTHINNSYIIQGFRSSIISSHRQLTRMKPNRRTGFLQMGNCRTFNTSLLVAVDVSGSISNKKIGEFYSTVNRIFRYGITTIDCVQFDSDLGEILSLRQSHTEITVKGRGGTSFQPIFDYMSIYGKKYDGLMILTDGQAPIPIVQEKRAYQVLWVCSDRQAYDANHTWMEKIGRTCYL